MGHVYTELPAIPVPDNCHIDWKSKQVSRYYRVNGKRRRHVVGYATTDGLMFANDVFRTQYPGEWDAAFADRASDIMAMLARRNARKRQTNAEADLPDDPSAQ